jgi:5'-methylthioadenosine phosphorylase
VPIGIIGGSGLYELEGFEVVTTLHVETPWGPPSSPITISQGPGGTYFAFLSRHGPGHTLPPSEVPSRANIAALKHLGCGVIIAFSAVGSLREEIRPRDFVIPNQVIDRTRGFRPDSFFEKGLVGHIMFADPFDHKVSSIVAGAASALVGDGIKMHTKESRGKDQILVCMEGPAFSTRAESNLYRSWDGAVINMYNSLNRIC